MAIYKDGSFDTLCLVKKNGETISFLGLDYSDAYEEFAEQRGISESKAWANGQLMEEFNQLYPQFAKDYNHEKKNFYTSEEIPDEEVEDISNPDDEIDVGRIREEISDLDRDLHSDRPDETEKETIL